MIKNFYHLFNKIPDYDFISMLSPDFGENIFIMEIQYLHFFYPWIFPTKLSFDI